MKAIMYHYISPEKQNLPHLHYLHLDDFVKQLEYFGNEYGFISLEDFQQCILSNKPIKGVVLTFDDGFKDHYSYVLPELLKRGLWGIFYIATSPFLAGKLIDVHRIHMLLGKYGENEIAKSLQRIITKDMLSHAHVKEFSQDTYLKQNNNFTTNYVKRLLNYFIDYKHRRGVLDELMSIYYPNEEDLVQAFYMTKAEIKHLNNSGMVIGSHTVNHPVMSKISVSEQGREIESSFQMIESIVGKSALKTFCYPYGGFHSFTAYTEQLLEKNACAFSFNVEARDISEKDLAFRRQALPRYDCNAFPYGSCR